MTTGQWLERLGVRLLRGLGRMALAVLTYPRRAARAWGELMRWVGTGLVGWLVWSVTGAHPGSRWLFVAGLLLTAHRHGRETPPPGEEPTPLDGEEAGQQLGERVPASVGEGFTIIPDPEHPRRSHVVWDDVRAGADEGKDQ